MLEVKLQADKFTEALNSMQCTLNYPASFDIDTTTRLKCRRNRFKANTMDRIHTNPDIFETAYSGTCYNEPLCNEDLGITLRTIFFTPVIVKYMKKNSM